MDFSQNTAFSGLGTITFIPASNGNYVFDGKISLPGSDSMVVVTINKNGSPVYNTVASAQGFRCVQELITSDTITIVISSSASVDQSKNSVKTVLSISAGE